MVLPLHLLSFGIRFKVVDRRLILGEITVKNRPVLLKKNSQIGLC